MIERALVIKLEAEVSIDTLRAQVAPRTASRLLDTVVGARRR